MKDTNADIRREHGQALTEYALILGLVCAAAVLAFTEFGHSVLSLYTSVVFH